MVQDASFRSHYRPVRRIACDLFAGIAVTLCLASCTVSSSTEPRIVRPVETGSAQGYPYPPAPAEAPVPAPPMPVPVAEPPPAAGPAPAGSGPVEGVDTALNWNYWVEQPPATAMLPDPVASIEIGRQYHLRVRLSATDLARYVPEVAGVLPSAELKETLSELVQDEARQTAEFFAIISAADPGALEIPAADRTATLTISLARLRELLSEPPGPEPAADAEAIERAFLGDFAFRFRVLSEGAHKFGIALVNKETGIPVQTFTAEVATSGSGAPLERLATTMGFLAADSPPADLSLILHDLSSTSAKALVATLAVRTPATGKYEFMAWNIGEDLEFLNSAVSLFRNSVREPLSAEQWRRHGWEFGRIIFEPRVDGSAALSADNRAVAERARKAVYDAAQASSSQAPSTFIVRLASQNPALQKDFSSPTLPIGAIALGATPETAVFLGERLSLALLLPGQALTRGAACPTAWYVAAPPDSISPDDALAIANRVAQPFWKFAGTSAFTQSDTLAELGTWLDDRDTANQPVVFSFLGHNSAKGELYLKKSKGKIAPSAMRRNFGRSSVAILNACETGTDTIGPGTPIGRLAQLKVGTTIATMAPVNGYLAAAYMNCISAVLGQKKDLTVGELHLHAVQCMWSPERSAPWGLGYAFSAEALKYFVVGNPFQKICSPGGDK